MRSLLFLLVLTALTNCTIEKRLFRPGFSVSFHHKLKNSGNEQVENDLYQTKYVKVAQENRSHPFGDTIHSDLLVKAMSLETEHVVNSVKPEAFENKKPKKDIQQALIKVKQTNWNDVKVPEHPFTPTSSRLFNGILAFFIVLLGIGIGAILFVPDLFFALLGGQSPIYDGLSKKVRKENDPRTFKTILVKSIAITIRVLLLLSAALLLTLLAIYFILTYGWVAILITAIVVLLLILLLAAISGDGLMRWLFIGWGK